MEVREGGALGAPGPLVHRYCAGPGSQVPPAITSRGPALQLRLQVSSGVGVRLSATFSNISNGTA